MSQTNDTFNPFDPTGMLKNIRDANLDAWSKMMIDLVNTDAYARVTGQLLDAYLANSAPFRKAVESALTQEARKGRRSGRSIHIVIAEDGDRLPALHRIRDARRRNRHVGEPPGIGHQGPHGRIEKGRGFLHLNTAPGEHPRQQVRQFVALHDRKRARCGALVEPLAPAPAGCRALHAEEGALG